MRRLPAAVATLAATAALATGCGSGGSDPPNAASIVPQNAGAYLSINTDLGSSQLTSAKSIIDKFPGGPKLLASIESQGNGQGINVKAIASSVGPVLDVAALGPASAPFAVGFAMPSDEKAFTDQLKAGGEPYAVIDGWTVFADEASQVAAVKDRTGNLADDANYKAAIATVPSDVIARGYIAGTEITSALTQALKSFQATGSLDLSALRSTKWIASALTSSDGAVKLEVHVSATAAQTATATTGTAGSLADQLPGGALVAASLKGSGAVVTAGLSKELQALPKGLAKTLGPVLGALGGPIIAYVRPGAPIPEVTAATKPAHPAAVVLAISGLISNLTTANPVPANVSGANLLKADLGAVTIYYGTFGDGEVVVSDSANAVAELNGSVGKLSDDSGFKDAKSGAGLPDDNGGFVYADIKDLLPLIDGFAQLASQPVPAQVDGNLKPLDTALIYGSRNGDIFDLVAYLKTR